VVLDVNGGLGLAPGGFNFDAKVRRESFEPVDLFHAHVGSMDAFAQGLKIAAAIRKDGLLKDFVKQRYSSWDAGIGAKIETGNENFETLETYILAKGTPDANTSGRQEIIDLLRQRSRPYLFSNTLAPVIAGASLEALRLLRESTHLRDTLEENTRYFREAMTAAGFDIVPGTHPIVPVMLGDASLAARFAEAMLGRGVYVVGFSYPVVPAGKARIRTQISAAHTREDLENAVAAFSAVKRELGV